MISKNFRKLFKKDKNYGKKPSPTKENSSKKVPNEGCYKCGETDHEVKNCPMWKVEWRK